MSGVGRFIRKRRAKRAAFMADPAIPHIAAVSFYAGFIKATGKKERVAFGHVGW